MAHAVHLFVGLQLPGTPQTKTSSHEEIQPLNYLSSLVTYIAEVNTVLPWISNQ